MYSSTLLHYMVVSAGHGQWNIPGVLSRVQVYRVRAGGTILTVLNLVSAGKASERHQL